MIVAVPTMSAVYTIYFLFSVGLCSLANGEHAQCSVTSCTGMAGAADVQNVAKVISDLQASVDRLTAVLAKPRCCSMGTGRPVIQAHDFPIIHVDGARWRRFWWYNTTSWPGLVHDVLYDTYGNCDPGAPYCFSRLPSALMENQAEMLGEDSAGNVYRWKFNPSNNVAHAVWEAFHDGKEGKIIGGNTWNPKAVKGNAPTVAQDSFQYRMEHGVKSLAIDDDTCDCKTSLSLGHGMCLGGFSTQYGPENVFGVDLLYDPACQTPSPRNALFLYFRDDDDCLNVKCPDGYQCSDGIYTYECTAQ